MLKSNEKTFKLGKHVKVISKFSLKKYGEVSKCGTKRKPTWVWLFSPSLGVRESHYGHSLQSCGGLIFKCNSPSLALSWAPIFLLLDLDLGHEICVTLSPLLDMILGSFLAFSLTISIFLISHWNSSFLLLSIIVVDLFVINIYYLLVEQWK